MCNVQPQPRYVCLFFEVKTLESDFMDAWAASMLFTLLKEGEGGRFAAKGGQTVWSLIQVCLLTNLDTEAMREIVDRYFGDSWVVAYALGPESWIGGWEKIPSNAALVRLTLIFQCPVSKVNFMVFFYLYLRQAIPPTWCRCGPHIPQPSRQGWGYFDLCYIAWTSSMENCFEAARNDVMSLWHSIWSVSRVSVAHASVFRPLAMPSLATPCDSCKSGIRSVWQMRRQSWKTACWRVCSMRTDETSRNSYGHVLRIFLVILRQRKGRRASHVCIKMTNEAESSSIYQHLCIHLYNMNDANINVVYIYIWIV